MFLYSSLYCVICVSPAHTSYVYVLYIYIYNYYKCSLIIYKHHLMSPVQISTEPVQHFCAQSFS